MDLDLYEVRATFRHAAGLLLILCRLLACGRHDYSKSKERARILASIYTKFAKWPRQKLTQSIDIHSFVFLQDFFPNTSSYAVLFLPVPGNLTYIYIF